MRRLCLVITLMLVVMMNTVCLSETCSFTVPDLTDLTKQELEELIGDVSAELKLHHEVSSTERHNVIDALERELKKHFEDNNLRILWPLFGLNYSLAKQMDHISVSTALSFKDENGTKGSANIYAEFFQMHGGLSLVALLVGDKPIVDMKSSVPDDFISKETAYAINARTGLNLTSLSVDELNALLNAAENEIKLNHKTSGKNEDVVYNLLKNEVESFYASQGIESVSWPWFEYIYTCDWGCYTATTHISVKNEDKHNKDISVYAEAFPVDDDYKIVYMEIDGNVLCDSRNEYQDKYCRLFMDSRAYLSANQYYQQKDYDKAYDIWITMEDYYDSSARAQKSVDMKNHQSYRSAKALMIEEKYDDAIAVFESLGNYSDSASKAAECEELIKRKAYDAAVELMNSGKYDEAITSFEALNGYSDSTDRIAECEELINRKAYDAAVELMSNGKYDEAITAFTSLGEYLDSLKQLESCEAKIHSIKFSAAEELLNDGKLEEALKSFESLDSCSKCEKMISNCREQINKRDYQNACELYADYKFNAALAGFQSLHDYKDSEKQAEECTAAISTIDRIVTVSENEIDVFLRSTYELKPIVTDLNGMQETETALSFSSENNQIAKVSKDGIISAVKTGHTYISIKASDNKYVGVRVSVNVVQNVTKVQMSESTLNLEISTIKPSLSKAELKVELFPEDAYLKSVTWNSDNTDVAVVDENGNVTALSVGKATITAVSNDPSEKSASCVVKVNQGVETVSFEIPDNILFIGKDVTIKPTILPENAANTGLTWASSDASIATVSDKGVLKGVASGAVTISAVSNNGVTHTARVEVKNAPKKMKISASAKLIAKNHVGSNWEYAFSLNGNSFKSSESLVVEVGQTVELVCSITERDKNPDYGSMKLVITITDEIMKNGYSTKSQVFVQENQGRYSGYSAEWLVTFKMAP